MKLINTSALVLIGAAVAKADDVRPAEEDPSFVEVKEETEAEIDPKKLGGIVKMTHFRIINTDPSFAYDRKLFGKMIQNYGCHCFNANREHLGGRGEPKDQLDAACRKLYKCHKCIAMDYTDEPCDTRFGGYKYQYNDDGSIGCETPDKKPACEKSQCQCEREFADTLHDLFTGNSVEPFQWDTALWLNVNYVKKRNRDNQPVFDYEDQCQFGVNNQPDNCCGVYPHRVPYNTNDNECCEAAGRPYLQMTQLCCEDGSVQPVSRGCN